MAFVRDVHFDIGSVISTGHFLKVETTSCV